MPPPVHLDIFRLLLFLLLNQGNSWIAQDPVVQVPCLAQGHRILVEDSGARCNTVQRRMTIASRNSFWG